MIDGMPLVEISPEKHVWSIDADGKVLERQSDDRSRREMLESFPIYFSNSSF